MAITTLVYTSETHNRKIHYLTPQEGYAEPTVPSGDETPVSQPVDAASLLGRWKSLNLDPQVREKLLNSWAEGSKAQYLSYLRRWATFCSENNISQTRTSLEMGTKFLYNTTPYSHAKPIILPRFKNYHVCPVRAIQEYLLATAGKRKSKSLIVSYFNFSVVTAKTIAKYI